MDTVPNSQLHLTRFTDSTQWQLEVPYKFVRGFTSPTTEFTIYTQFGGPWRLQAKRRPLSDRYYFHGLGFLRFVGESQIEFGDPLLFSRFKDFELYVIVFGVNGKGKSIKGAIPMVNDWLVMLKSCTKDGDIDFESDVAQQGIARDGLEDACWQVQFDWHRIYNFVIDANFSRKAQIEDGCIVSMINSHDGKEWAVHVQECRGKLYLRDGLDQFVRGCHLEQGDIVTFKRGGARDGTIAVLIHIIKQKGPSGHLYGNSHRGATSSELGCGSKTPNASNPNAGNFIVLRFRDSYRKFMNIPMAFAHAANLNSGDLVKVRVDDRNVWSFRVIACEGYVRLSAGWRKFVEAMKLEENTKLVFTILSGDDGADLSLSIGC